MALAVDPRNGKLDGGAGFSALTRRGYIGTWGELKDSLKDPIARLSAADPKDVQQIAALQLELLSAYYGAALVQSERSFICALIGSGIGLVFLAVALAGSVASLVSGAIVIVSSIGFHLYSKSSSQLSAIHSSLDAQQRYLLANSICESLEGEVRNNAKTALIQEMSRGRR